MKSKVSVEQIAILLLLLIGTWAWIGIPFYKYIGLDFENVFRFQNGASPDTPYSVTGSSVGDPFGRFMAYPPFLYVLFYWTRFISFELARTIWCTLVYFGTLLSLLVWMPHAKRQEYSNLFGAFAIVLIGSQFPTSFSVERGNSDVVGLILWSLSFYCFKRKRGFWAGILGALAISPKIYPIFAVGVLICFIVPSIIRGSVDRKYYFRCLAGGLVGLAVPAMLQMPQLIQYVSEVLPRLAIMNGTLSAVAHSIWGLFDPGLGSVRKFGVVSVGFLMLIPWAIFGMRSLESNVGYVFSGALAVSTFFAKTSYDYNLITVYPLLVTLLFSGDGMGLPSRRVRLAYFVTGIVILAMHISHDLTPVWFSYMHLVFQCAWIGCLGWTFVFFSFGKTRLSVPRLASEEGSDTRST